MGMKAIFKKAIWFLLIGSIAVAVIRNAGSVDNFYPWLVKESHKAQTLTTKLDKKYVGNKLKPLKPLPIFTQLPGSHPTTKP